MAIDGIKIIDSDSAYDIYHPIMGMFDDGIALENIKKEIDKAGAIYSFSELETEIYFTSYALAMWEIGGLTENLIQNVRKIVKKGASALWNDIAPNAQKSRQKELVKLLKKIDQPNTKIKKPKNYKQHTDVIFSDEEVFSIELKDKTYGAVILITSFQEAKTLYYFFAEIWLRTEKKPTMEEILKCKIHARINIGFDTIRTISHKYLLPLKDKFEKVGTIKIAKNNKRLGCYPGMTVENYEDLCKDWNWKGDKRNRKKIMNLIELLENKNAGC